SSPTDHRARARARARARLRRDQQFRDTPSRVIHALRIALSVAVAPLAARWTGLTFQSVHRLLGTFMYLAGLLALCLTTRFWLSSRGIAQGNSGRAGGNQPL